MVSYSILQKASLRLFPKNGKPPDEIFFVSIQTLAAGYGQRAGRGYLALSKENLSQCYKGGLRNMSFFVQAVPEVGGFRPVGEYGSGARGTRLQMQEKKSGQMALRNVVRRIEEGISG